jgi:hypothetical protein
VVLTGAEASPPRTWSHARLSSIARFWSSKLATTPPGALSHLVAKGRFFWRDNFHRICQLPTVICNVYAVRMMGGANDVGRGMIVHRERLQRRVALLDCFNIVVAKRVRIHQFASGDLRELFRLSPGISKFARFLCRDVSVKIKTFFNQQTLNGFMS